LSPSRRRGNKRKARRATELEKPTTHHFKFFFLDLWIKFGRIRLKVLRVLILAPEPDFLAKHRLFRGRRIAPPTKWLFQSLKVRFWCGYTTLLELILSKILD
jgi:hypothetical protein